MVYCEEIYFPFFFLFDRCEENIFSKIDNTVFGDAEQENERGMIDGWHISQYHRLHT